jgi:hypothetical protein
VANEFIGINLQSGRWWWCTFDVVVCFAKNPELVLATRREISTTTENSKPGESEQDADRGKAGFW